MQLGMLTWIAVADFRCMFNVCEQLKVKKLEQLVRLKDSKIDSLRLQLENGVAY